MESSYQLLWVLLFAVVATIVLQEMAARLGFVSGEGLSAAFQKTFQKGLTRYLVFFLIIGAILVGNSAYEAGNIAGGVMGLELLTSDAKFWPLLIGIILSLLFLVGSYKWIERLLIALVVLMSICFLFTAIAVKPSLSEVAAGFIPSGIQDHYLLILALVGTTIVPYNLFLHASTISKKYTSKDALKDIRVENAVAIILGGFISMLIVITAAGSAGAVENISNARDLSIQLEPLFGSGAKYLMGMGLLAAGFSSSLTAPLAVGYVAKGLFGWEGDERGLRFKLTCIAVVAIGVLVSTFDLPKILIIKFAQVTNALLLPLIAMFLLYLANRKEIMGQNRNGVLSNVLGGLVVLLTLALSVRSFWKLLA